VTPNCQSGGRTCQEVALRWSPVITLNVSDSPVRTSDVCHSCPQLRFSGVHFTLLFPFTDSPATSPAPPTFDTITRLKYGFPVITNNIYITN
ncbi:Os08g0561950, partial [Oryza sativa Japonica Group]